MATKDPTVHPLGRFVAKQLRATAVEVASSHVPMLPHPALVLDVRREAAHKAEVA